MKVVIDCGNGVAGAVAPRLVSELGCEVVPLFCEIDGNFPNHHPDPADPHNLKDLISKVRAEKADLGLAFDGDGDRLGVVTKNGSIIYADRQLMLFAADVLSRPGRAAATYAPRERLEAALAVVRSVDAGEIAAKVSAKADLPTRIRAARLRALRAWTRDGLLEPKL